MTNEPHNALALNLTNAQARLLAALPTAHEETRTAADLAGELFAEPRPALVTSGLGVLRRLGLVERSDDITGQGATWCRFDSAAPGLDCAQAAALRQAEETRPSDAQAQALETYGPEGLTLRADLGEDLGQAVEVRNPSGLADLAAAARNGGLFHRAAALYQAAARASAGHGRRERYQAAARQCEQAAQAQAQAQGQDAPQVVQGVDARRLEAARQTFRREYKASLADSRFDQARRLYDAQARLRALGGDDAQERRAAREELTQAQAAQDAQDAPIRGGRWTLEPGRTLALDGVELFRIAAPVDAPDVPRELSPRELNQAAREVLNALEAESRLVAAVREVEDLRQVVARQAQEVEALRASVEDRRAVVIRQAAALGRRDSALEVARGALRAQAEELGRRDAQDKARAYDAPTLALPSPYRLEAWARLEDGGAVVLVALPDNKATPWATFWADGEGHCMGGDYIGATSRRAALVAYRARLERACRADVARP